MNPVDPSHLEPFVLRESPRVTITRDDVLVQLEFTEEHRTIQIIHRDLIRMIPGIKNIVQDLKPDWETDFAIFNFPVTGMDLNATVFVLTHVDKNWSLRSRRRRRPRQSDFPILNAQSLTQLAAIRNVAVRLELREFLDCTDFIISRKRDEQRIRRERTQ
ncbi:hypothetical protein GCK72_024393 [Caenorhabditis remanei]|nr:hypothetical protein GCK72_024393 [Caenorhabditis remanei]KAF1747927.1 hypothetical protein GCK72_024393 [Caenorhabditis remanei]